MPPRPLLLKEMDAQAVLLVRAFEQADPEGVVLARSVRERADAEAPQNKEKPQAWLVRRARTLSAEIETQVPLVPGLRRVTRLAGRLGPLLLIVAFVLGLASNLVGPARHINLLSVPLLGILAWNLLMYAIFVLVWVLKGRAQKPGRGAARVLAPVSTLLYLRRRLGGLDRSEAASAVTAGGVRGYLDAWRTAGAALVEARGRRLMHLAAMVLMLGAVAGMYVRGLIFEYRATWESTFFDALTVRDLLHGILGPAASILGVEIPPLLPLRVPGDGPAALWIHLFAVTAVLFVVLPRGLLALVEALRLLRLSRRVPMPEGDPYLRRLLATGRAEPPAVELWPYSLELSIQRREQLLEALHDAFGRRADIRLQPVLAYGEDVPVLAEESESGDAVLTQPLVLFNLAQTPEAEVHGELLRALAARHGEPPRALIEVSAYRQRLHGDETRLQGRKATWTQVVEAAGARATFVDLEAMDRGALAAALGDEREESERG